MKTIVVFEPTDDECGLEIVDDGDCVTLEDIFNPLLTEAFDDMESREYSITKKDIPFIIRGLQEFI